MVPLKERLSLDWLIEAQSRRSLGSVESGPLREALPANLEDALLAYGGLLLRALKSQPGKTAFLHNLVKEQKLQLSDALPVVNYLLTRGHVQKLEDDPFTANYKLRLTERGEQLAF